MIRFLVLSTALWAALAVGAHGEFTPAPSFSAPHAAVVRIVVPERDGTTYGSGALVAVSESSGLVVTNWHVVRDGAGPVAVYFPDGFRSGAVVLRVDRDWDLAALAIWRPNVQPIALSAQAPRPGDALTIAGYGSGPYRAVTGQCTQYVSPGGNQPFEMIELSAPRGMATRADQSSTAAASWQASCSARHSAGPPAAIAAGCAGSSLRQATTSSGFLRRRCWPSSRAATRRRQRPSPPLRRPLRLPRRHSPNGRRPLLARRRGPVSPTPERRPPATLFPALPARCRRWRRRPRDTCPARTR